MTARYAVVAVLALGGCTSGEAGVGAPCGEAGDCQPQLQCLAATCTPRCQTFVDCGDGFECTSQGECAAVSSAIGDDCRRELDCGAGQTCQLELDDESRVGSCQATAAGATTGSECQTDTDCRSGLCSLGRCVQLCADDADCPGATACVSIPRLSLEDRAPLFLGCLQDDGIIETELGVYSPRTTLRVPVPSNARSLALIATVNDGEQSVGATEIVSPSGELLYQTPRTLAGYYENVLRYAPAAGISTLLIPNAPRVALETGVYRVEVSSLLEGGELGTEVPNVSVVYKLGDGATLDLHFHFLNLEEHPCREALGGELDADLAQRSRAFQEEYLGALADIFARADIGLGELRYSDLENRPDLDGLEADDLPRLLALSGSDTGIHVFFVRSIAPAGIQALAGGTPGPPGRSGTRASGIAIATDTLCYRSWTELARLTAHELARHMGLFRNREPDGAVDPITDSGEDANNLMYFSEFGGTELSPGQAQVLRLYPGLGAP